MRLRPPEKQDVPRLVELFNQLGYPSDADLHVEFEKYELLFSSAAQLEHYIKVLSQTTLLTERVKVVVAKK